jgi:hypothetical protein
MVACRAYYWKGHRRGHLRLGERGQFRGGGRHQHHHRPLPPANVAAYVQSPTQNRITWDAVTQNTGGAGSPSTPTACSAPIPRTWR